MKNEFVFTVDQLNKILEALSEMPIKYAYIFEKVKKSIEDITIAQIKDGDKENG